MARIKLNENKLKREPTEHVSGDTTKLHGLIPSISHKHYRIIEGTSVGGDAPKELLRVYEYKEGEIRANRPHQWPIFIVKTGHKWYPFESITEHLLNRIGQEMGLHMADSRLAFINGQLRFMSRLFRSDRDQILEHGAELYSGYLADKDFVEEIEEQQMARHFFTVTFTYETLQRLFPHQALDMFLDFTRMLVFDAIVGNNDRHFYNWGVLKHLRSKHQPHFSPIYDTARALFWNRAEHHFDRYKSSQRSKMIQSYVNKSKPKIGIEKNADANHFDIIKLLAENKFSGTRNIVKELITLKKREIALALVNDEFKDILSQQRKEFITECLTLRFSELGRIIE